MFGRSGVRRSSWDQSQISTKSSSKFTKLRGLHSKTEAAIIGNILLPPFQNIVVIYFLVMFENSKY
jgi:hypothetical protein